MKTTVNTRVRELRKALKLTQEKFAIESELSASLLTKAETGAIPVSNDMIEKICERWKVPSNWLEKGEGKLSFEKNMTEKASNPWKDEAWNVVNSKLNHYEDEIKFYRGLLQQNFLKVVKKAG